MVCYVWNLDNTVNSLLCRLGTASVHVFESAEHYCALQDIRPCMDGPPVGPKLISRGDLVKCKYDGSLPLTNPTCNGCC